MKSLFRNTINVRCFIICIIGLQLLCIVFFVHYINQCSTEHDSMNIIPSIKTNSDPFYEQEKEVTVKKKINNKYIKLSNYRAHLNTDANFIDFGEINEYSLCGIILKISNINDNNLNKLYLICDSMIECIGFSIHPTIGVLFHNSTSFPLQYVRNWNFYIKNIKQHKQYEMDKFTNKRINYTMNLISSSMIPSLSSLGLIYSIPIIPRKFMSFEWNVGRTNNQLYSFEAMLQYVVIYQLSIIFPFTSHRNHELGMMINQSLSIWDMIKLSEFADFIFEYEITTMSIPDITDYVISNNHDINYDDNTFDINLNSDDLKWKKYFNDNNMEDTHIINEPNWNLLQLLEYRQFTNNEHWTLSHENLIHNNWNNDEWQCYVSRGIRDKIPHETLTNCRLIQFCLGRYAHFKLDDWPIFDVLHFMIPSKRIRSAVDNTIKFWFEQDNKYRIGVHRRAMKEGGKDSSGSPYVCRYRAKSLSKSGRYAPLKNHIQNVINKKNPNDQQIKIEAITDLYDRTCAIDFDTIQEILKFHKQQPLLNNIFWDNHIKNYKERGNNIEPWFLACDNQEPQILNEFIEKYGAITLNGKNLADFWNGPLYWNMAKNMEIEQKLYTRIVEKQYLKYLKLFRNRDELESEHKNWLSIISDKHKSRWWYDMSKIEFWRKEIVVFDMWMLRKSQFFVGSWHSTLTRNVCHWRGYQNMYNSTNCYLAHKWRAMYQQQHKPPINTDYAYNWFDINAVDKPKLIWQDGK